MEIRKVKCPYDGIPYNKVPGYVDGYGCPYCKGIGANHIEVERTLLTNEEAEEILHKYVKRHWVNGRAGYAYSAGKEILEYAWYSQHWPSYAIQGNGYSKHCNVRDWMGDDLKLAFEWYLDGVGRDLGYGYGRAKDTFENGYGQKLEKELTERARKLQKEKWEKQRIAKEKREAKLQAEGEALVKSLNVGDVAMVKFGDSWWGNRGMKVLEIEDGFIAGFYLDRETTTVPGDAPEKEGYVYSKPTKWSSVRVNGEYVPGKLEWDGKTFIKTRTYESKMIKFVKSKINNPIIKK